MGSENIFSINYFKQVCTKYICFVSLELFNAFYSWVHCINLRILFFTSVFCQKKLDKYNESTVVHSLLNSVFGFVFVFIETLRVALAEVKNFHIFGGRVHFGMNDRLFKSHSDELIRKTTN